jgi:tetratricopeptide (TPR) repeat protein
VFEEKNKAAELSKMGDGYMVRALYAKALQYYQDSLAASQAVDDLEGAAAAYASMGRAYMAAKDPDSAEREYRNSQEYARMALSGVARANAKSGLGEVAFARGDKEGALALFEEAVAIAAAAAGKDDKALAVALHDRGVAKAALGRSAEALADLSSADSRNLKAKRWTELGANRYAAASTLAATGKTAEALAAAVGALDADKRGENSRAIPLDLAAAASLSARLGKDADAWDYWRRAFDSALAADDAATVRKALTSLVGLAPKLERADEGKRYEALLAQLDAAEKGK